MKNILIVIDSLGTGGAEKVMFALSQGFVKRGYKIDLIICDNSIKIDIPDYIKLHILDFKKSIFHYFRYRLKLKNMIKNIEKQNAREFDLILVNLFKSIKLMRKIKHKNTYHILHNAQSQYIQNKKGLKLFFQKRHLQSLYNNLNLITISDGMTKDLLSLGIKPKSVKNIYNPFDFDYIKKQSEKNSNMVYKNYIVHLGRFVPVKRHDILLKAYKKASIDAILLLYGEGELKDDIEVLIKQLALESKVKIMGFTSNPYPIIKNAKMLVVSSDFEGFSAVIVEALYLKTPVVSTNCPTGPKEILTKKYSFCLVEVGNIDSLANKIKTIYDMNLVIDNTIITNRFSLDIIINQYEKLIK